MTTTTATTTFILQVSMVLKSRKLLLVRILLLPRSSTATSTYNKVASSLQHNEISACEERSQTWIDCNRTHTEICDMQNTRRNGVLFLYSCAHYTNFAEYIKKRTI